MLYCIWRQQSVCIVGRKKKTNQTATHTHRTRMTNGSVTLVGTTVLNAGVENGISRQAIQPGSITKKFVLNVDSHLLRNPPQDEKTFKVKLPCY